MTLHSSDFQRFVHIAQRQLSAFVRHVRANVRDRAIPAARRAAERGSAMIQQRPGVAAGVLLGCGALLGVAGHSLFRSAEQQRLMAAVDAQQSQLEATRREAQREVNALAARLGELQADANRLNALGERLTRIAQLGDGEFDFQKPVGVGGAGPVRDMPATELRSGLGALGAQLKSSGRQLTVLEALLFNRELDRHAMPSRAPILNSYITSGFGGRADPFGGGSQNHKGVDFEADTGDPVLAVADGVVTYSGVRSGYGNVVEVDHGNGYVTRYAHNSRLLVQVGDLVRGGREIAKAGSTGRSTGAHVHFEVWENGVVVDPMQFLGGQPTKKG
ncbi:MAG: M23 family peptidase [Lysobacter sp.]|nr:MAG: M23 family peptidase [Lysobacter sp.]